jgi:ABC-2 type transport system ATP-binding protein
VISVAQLGTRLHALIEPAEDDPEGLVRDAMQRASVRCSVELTRASLEDVFVATTRRTDA